MALETNTYVFGWNRPIVGREHVAAELFKSTTGYFEKCQKSGKLESFEPVFLRAHGGDMNGFFLLRGTHQNLEAIAAEDEFVDIFMRAVHCLHDVGLVPGFRGNAVQEVMTRWTRNIPR